MVFPESYEPATAVVLQDSSLGTLTSVWLLKMGAAFRTYSLDGPKKGTQDYHDWCLKVKGQSQRPKPITY